MPAAPSNSNTPLTITAALGHGRYGDTMRSSASVTIKCAKPAMKNQAKTLVRPINRVRGMVGVGIFSAAAGLT